MHDLLIGRIRVEVKANKFRNFITLYVELLQQQIFLLPLYMVC